MIDKGEVLLVRVVLGLSVCNSRVDVCRWCFRSKLAGDLFCAFERVDGIRGRVCEGSATAKSGRLQRVCLRGRVDHVLVACSVVFVVCGACVV